MPKFRTLKFSATELNGEPFGSGPNLIQWDRYKGSTLQIKTTQFASDEAAFKTVSSIPSPENHEVSEVCVLRRTSTRAADAGRSAFDEAL